MTAIHALVSLLFSTLTVSSLQGQDPVPPREEAGHPATHDLSFGPRFLIGGVGGVYLFPEPGELVIEVIKRDRGQFDRRTDLRAILAGPDRRPIQEAVIPDDGRPRGSGPGPAQRCRLTARVERRGVYVLNITVSQDRYGEEAIWGFRSNCRKFLIETARGHKDETHQEPIVLASPEESADLYFLPRQKEFTVELSDLSKDARSVQLFDPQGKLAATLSVDAGRASHRAENKTGPLAPWRLRLSSAQAVVNISGVTRWNPDDVLPDQACWTSDSESWFPWWENRWLLTPYSRAIYVSPDERAQVKLQVRNDALRERTIELAIEYPNAVWPAALSVDRVTLGPKQSTEVTLRAAAPPAGQERVCYARATPLDSSGFTTYSTVTLKRGEAPANKPLSLPLLLKPYQQENEQFGWLPNFPAENQVYFDLRNRPFVVTSDGLARLVDRSWRVTSLKANLFSEGSGAEALPVKLLTTKIAFDQDNDIYLLGSAGGIPALLRSTNEGAAFTAYPIPGQDGRSQTFDLEQFSGHNPANGPPCFVRFTHTASDEKLIWRRLYDLDLFVPRKTQGKIIVGDPLRISDRCIGLSAHSGIPSSLVSRGSKAHVAWGEATDPKVKVPGLPAFVVTYDRETGRLGKPVLVGHGAPANDIHNTPSITMDSKGYLHVVSGTHGTPFPYARSLEANDAGAGFTTPEFVGAGLRQTYVGLVCAPDDTLHLAFRLWRTGEPYPASSHATLAWQRKPPGQPWQAPTVLVVAPFSEYGVYYHRLTLDRTGRLFLSYDYWSTFWFYRNDHFGRRRALLVSPNGGELWKLANAKDLWPE